MRRSHIASRGDSRRGKCPKAGNLRLCSRAQRRQGPRKRQLLLPERARPAHAANIETMESETCCLLLARRYSLDFGGIIRTLEVHSPRINCAGAPPGKFRPSLEKRSFSKFNADSLQIRVIAGMIGYGLALFPNRDRKGIAPLSRLSTRTTQ